MLWFQLVNLDSMKPSSQDNLFETVPTSSTTLRHLVHLLISILRMGLWLMEVVLLQAKIGLKLCRESWQIVILRVSCVAGKASSFFFFCYKLILLYEKRQATGGSIPNILPRLSDSALNVTQSINNTGNVSGFVGILYCMLIVLFIRQMFEKFSNLDVDSAGQGGEYTVQVRFLFFSFY